MEALALDSLQDHLRAVGRPLELEEAGAWLRGVLGGSIAEEELRGILQRCPGLFIVEGGAGRPLNVVTAEDRILQLVRKMTSQSERHQRAVVLRLGSWRELHQDPAALQLLEAIAAWLLDPARKGSSAAGGLPIDTLGAEFFRQHPQHNRPKQPLSLLLASCDIIDVDRRTRCAAIASNAKLRSQAAGALHRCVMSQPLWRDRAREVAARQLSAFPPEAVLRALLFYGRELEEVVGGLPEGPASVQVGVAALLAAAALQVASGDATQATARCSFHLDDVCRLFGFSSDYRLDIHRALRSCGPVITAGPGGTFLLDMKLLTTVCQAQQLQDAILDACAQLHPPAAALQRLAGAYNATIQDAAGAPGCLEALHGGFAAFFSSAGASHQHTAAAAAAAAGATAAAASTHGTSLAGSSMLQREAGSVATTDAHSEPASREPRGWPASNVVTLPEAAFIRKTRLVGSAGEAAAMQLHIRGCRVLAVDTEAFMQPSDARRHTLSLVQIGAPATGRYEAAAYLVDMEALRQQRCAASVMQQLAVAFSDPAVTKVLHDARQDAEWLEAAGAGPLRGVWDTQVAAGVLALEEVRVGSEGAEGAEGGEGGGLLWRRMGLGALLGRYGLPMEEKESIKSKMKKAPKTFWKQRPLTPDMLAYAAGDVTPLLLLAHRLQTDLSQLPDLPTLLSHTQLLPPSAVHLSSFAAALHTRSHTVPCGEAGGRRALGRHNEGGRV